MMKKITFWLLLSVFLFSCAKDELNNAPTKKLTLFFVNDVHSQIDNFSKVKQIIDAERAANNVLVVSSGDMFSGNPVVDNYSEKGFPMIDMMNRVGFDVAALGNHDFDYGPEILKDRIEQSQFPWICANVNTNNSGLTQPHAYTTISAGDLRITFLGLIETGGSKFEVIPSTHPWRVKDFTFEPAQNIVRSYINLKQKENSDLLIALSHLGYRSYENQIGDFDLARQNYFFELIIGGHTHAIIDTTIANIPIFQAGAYLHYLAKIELTIQNKSIKTLQYTLIDLDKTNEFDAELQSKIDEYNNQPELNEVIGYSHEFHSRYSVGCFYTEALRLYTNADFALQNTGGIRSSLDQGDITKREIYEISPFNNGIVIYEMTVAQIKELFIGSGSGFNYSGLILTKKNNQMQVRDLLYREIPDDFVLKVVTNDYIPAVHSLYFPDNGVVQPLTAAETLIAYLQNINSEVDFAGCNRYFRF